MFDFVLSNLPILCFSNWLWPTNVPLVGAPAEFQPGWSPPPPPPPGPANVVAATLVDTGSEFLLKIDFDRDVTGADPFTQAHPWLYNADGGPGTIGGLLTGSGTASWLWPNPDPAGPSPEFVIPADSELDVVAGTYPIT